MSNKRPLHSPSLANLFSLLAIRSCALLVQCAVLAYVVSTSRTADNLSGLIASLLAFAALTAGSLWRLNKRWPVTDAEFFVQLLADVVGWSALMYFTGGANNPFISYYIVPLVVSAAVLPWRYTWMVAGSSLAAYSLLLYYYVPFAPFSPHAAMGHGDNANMHTLGMWFNFLFSAGLITYFVVRMGATLRAQEALNARRREDELRNEQIMAVASLAAGTAHELGTPLSTMTVLVDELASDTSLSEQGREDCDLLAEQLRQCRQTLTKLSDTAERASLEDTQVQPLAEFVEQTVARWAVRRPAVRYRVTAPEGEGSAQLHFESTLSQALENLLNNAADTGSELIEVGCGWDAQQQWISVRDWGPGLPAELAEQLGKPVLTSSGGLGIGLMISHATVSRYRGQLQLRNADDGGTIATLTLPRQQDPAHGG